MSLEKQSTSFSSVQLKGGKRDKPLNINENTPKLNDIPS